MSINQINNGDSGLTARTIINQVVTNVNNLPTTGTASYAITASYALNGGGGGGGGTPGGLNTQIQFNSASTFSGSQYFTYNYQSQSLQQGNSNQADGPYSHAEGASTQAIGAGSHAEGTSNITYGLYSHAEGSSTQTFGEASHAEGVNTIASGSYSHAEGGSTQAIGGASHAEGNDTKTGTTSAYSASIASGVITISTDYGDIAGLFPSNGKLFIYDTPFDDEYGKGNFIISQSSFDGTNTIVELANDNSNSSKVYILSLENTNTGDQIIPGDYSHAEGGFTQAIGNQSHAEGDSTQAVGFSSHAEGSGTQAIGTYSHAEGDNTKAIGNYSHAEGAGTQAIGYASHAEGSQTQALGSYSHTEGNGTQAIGNFSHTEGDNTQAIGIASHAEGRDTKTGITTAYSSSITSGIITLSADYGDQSSVFPSDSQLYIYDEPFEDEYGRQIRIVSQSYYNAPNTIIELANNDGTTSKAYVLNLDNNLNNNSGDQIIPGRWSHAEGTGTQAIGNQSHAEGNTTQAIGNQSHAEGDSTQAIGEGSHAEGLSTQTIGNNSHAEGNSTQTIGGYSHAEGSGTQTIGPHSHAEGSNTQAIGEFSHAEGYQAKSGYKGFSSNDIGTTTPGDIYLNSSYGDVSALFVGGNFIILSDTDDDNNYGTIKLEISSSTFDGTNTIITLVNTSISTTGATIGVFNDPEPVGANQIYIGFYSHAEGNSTQAIGWYSHAEGDNTKAIGDHSHAEGGFTQAIGDVSHAEGNSTQTIGSYSHAEGADTKAIGTYSHAEGDSTQAIGQYSHAEGKDTKTGIQTAYSASIVSGIITLSSTYNDVSEDFEANNRLYLYDSLFDNIYDRGIFIISQSYYSAPNTIIELYDTGVSTTTAYVGDIDYGLDNWNGNQIIPGDYSHAEGDGAVTIGNRSHAEGYNALAIGQWSHAEGSNTKAIGNYSHAEGSNTQAIGEFSHAEGRDTQAVGYSSHAEGYNTLASGSYQHVTGQYNTHGDDTSLFIIGNGTDDGTRSDAFKVRQSGSIILPVTSSGTPGWTGIQGEMIFGDDGSGNYVIWAYLGGNWKSGSLS